MLLKQQKESSHLFCSTANARIVPVFDIYISIMVVIIFMKEPTLVIFAAAILYFASLHTGIFGLILLVWFGLRWTHTKWLPLFTCGLSTEFCFSSVSPVILIILSTTHSEITELLIRYFCLSTTYRPTLLGKILSWPLQAPELKFSGSSLKWGIIWSPTKIHMVSLFWPPVNSDRN